MDTYLFYILSMLGCVGIAYIADKYNSKILRDIIIVILVIITGFRGENVGIDTANYVELWDAVLKGDFLVVEIGFQWLMLFLQNISTEPTILFFVCSLIIFGLTIIRLWDFRRIASFPVMIAALYMLFVMQSMNTMRQYCAIAIVFWGTKYLFQKKYWSFLIYVVLASLLHVSSLLAISFIGFDLLRWNSFSFWQKMTFVFLFILGLVLSVPIYNFIYIEYGTYFESEEVDFGLLTTVLFIFTLFSFYASKLWRKSVAIDAHSNDEWRYLIKVSFVAYAFGIILQSLGYFFPFMDRIGLIFSVWGIVFWGMLFKLTLRKPLKIVYFLSMFLLVMLPFLRIMISNGLGTVPYSFYWQ